MFILPRTSPLPLYEQLYQQLCHALLNGQWQPHQKLPSSRWLAEELAISRNTVEAAYQQLLAEGYIYAKPRSGYYAEALPDRPASCSPPLPPQELPPPTVNYDFRYGRLSPELFPFALWQRLTSDAFSQQPEHWMDYLPPQGDWELRRQLAVYLQTQRQVRCRPEQICLCSGSQQALMLAARLLPQTANCIGVETPGFIGAYQAFAAAGYATAPLTLDHHGLRVKELPPDGLSAVYVTPSHQFPTGRILSITRRLQLLAWATAQETFIIEDDYNCQLRYNVRPVPALQSLAPERVFYCGSFSKILSPALRVAYLVIPEARLAALDQTQPAPCSVPAFIQKPLARLLQDEYWPRHLRKTTRALKQRHTCLVECLQREFGDRLSIAGLHAGLHLLLRIHWPATVTQLLKQAADAGLALQSPAILWQGTDSEHPEILLGFGALPLADIPAAVRCLREAWLR